MWVIIRVLFSCFHNKTTINLCIYCTLQVYTNCNFRYTTLLQFISYLEKYNDFIFQIQLEKIRQAENEVRWQHEEDVEDCGNCKQAFSVTKRKVSSHA